MPQKVTDAEMLIMSEERDLENHFKFFMEKCGHGDMSGLHPTQVREMRLAFYGGVGQVIIVMAELTASQEGMDVLDSFAKQLGQLALEKG